MGQRIIKIRTIKGQTYSVQETSDGSAIRYRRLPHLPQVPGYLVKWTPDSIVCGCPGYEYHGMCKHSEDVRELVATNEWVPGEDPTLFSIDEIGQWMILIKKNLLEYSDDVVFCGSYRRGMAFVHDIDVAVCAPVEDIQKALSSYQATVEGTSIIRFPVAIGDREIQIDINMTANKSEFGALVMYLTGSREFNILMRKRAQTMGMLLNRHGLFDTDGVCIASACEHSIFRALGMDNVEPCMRRAGLVNYVWPIPPVSETL